MQEPGFLLERKYHRLPGSLGTQGVIAGGDPKKKKGGGGGSQILTFCTTKFRVFTIPVFEDL